VVRAYDPAAAANAAHELPDLEFADTAEAAFDGADVAVIATDCPAYKTLDWAAARDRLRRPLVVDGRRLLDREAMTALGFTYLAVGTDRSAEGPLGMREVATREAIT
jgi:UDPglucose 6-dehydrogenase